MQVTYERDLRKSSMVVTMDTDPAGYQYRMCEKNRIPGLLSYEILVADGRVQFWYDITGLQSFETYLKTKQISQELFYHLFHAVYQVVMECEKYLLDENRLSLDASHIYVNPATQEIGFCFFPEQEWSLRQNFRNLIEYFMKHMEHGRDRSTELIYRIYQITLAEEYSLEEVQEFVEQLKYADLKHADSRGNSQDKEQKTENERVTAKADQPVNQSVSGEGKVHADRQAETMQPQKTHIFHIAHLLQPVWQHVPRFLEQYQSRKDKRTKREQEKLQVVFEPEAEPEREQTVFLGDRMQAKRNGLLFAYQGMEQGRNLYADQFPYLIGCKDGVDGCIERDGISRLHARITQETDGYYIEDLNSKNGTRVNGVLLNYQERVLLSPGMEIAFAGEKYIFYEKESNPLT